jgi:hypothetical protein
MTTPTRLIELEISIDYGQVYVYDQGAGIDFAGEAVMDALDDAQNSGRYVGVAGQLVDFTAPIQFNFTAPMHVEVWAAEPADDDSANWDHIVDVDLDLPTGKLTFEASGGGQPISCDVPPGSYRARLAGRGWDMTSPQGGGLDDYRVQLWPRQSAAEPTLVKAWPGWAKLFG